MSRRYISFLIGLLVLMGGCAASALAQAAFVSVSAASYQNSALAPESIVAGFGTGLAGSTQVATTLPLPTTLAGTTVTVVDSANNSRLAQLFFVSPTQVNYLLPSGTALGQATVTIRNQVLGQTKTGTINVANLAPGIFTADASGRGLPAAQVLRVKANGTQSYETVSRFDATTSRFVAVPVEFGAETDQLFLVIYGTGWRRVAALTQVTALISGTPVEVLAATAQGSLAGLDQVNIRLPRTLAGLGDSELALTFNGQSANAVRVTLKALATPTLFVANLRPVSGAISSASGVATLKLSADEKSAVLKFNYGNLSSGKTAAHIRGPANPDASGSVLFDIDAAEPLGDDSYAWTFTTVGALTPTQFVNELKAGRVYMVVQTAHYPAGELRGHFGVLVGSSTFVAPAPPPPLPSGTPSPRDAARFLTQATFGPRTPDITALQQKGYATWLNEQFAKPRSKHQAYLDNLWANGKRYGTNDLLESIWRQAIYNDDQLRQRVALALSEIIVVSELANGLYDNADGLATYYDILNEHAFGNYRQLLEAVTLNPAMGTYLNMIGNDKEDPDTGTIPNENYAREILQLFSIGVNKLHPDGTLQLSEEGLPQPTYNQEVIAGFARVFTGWWFGGNNVNNLSQWYDPPVINFRLPMANWPYHHSTSTKRLLNNVTLPANQSAQKDLQDALDNIFNHPNVGPFISQQLIQRLVTSNPSPGYVYRVASVFNNNGSGVRGDLKAVVRATLMDNEARSLDVVAQQGYGKQREPMIRLMTLLRAFNATTPSGRFRLLYIEDPLFAMGQNALRSPSVFNFFAPNYQHPGDLSAAGLVAPEFQISTEPAVISRANFFKVLVFYGYDYNEFAITLQYGELLPLASNPGALADRLDLLLLSGAMSPGLRAAVIKAVSAYPANDADWRVKTAVTLVTFSPEFVIQK